MKKTQRLFVLVLALCMLVQMLPVAAFEFEVPEAAEEIMEIADNAALSDDTIPGFPETTLDDSFGRLVAFWTFEGDDPGKAVYADESIGGNAYIWLYKANENSKTLNSTAEGYSSLTSTAWNIQCADTTVFKTGKDVPVGKYTVNMKIMRKKDGAVGNTLLQANGISNGNDLFMQTAASSKECEYVNASRSFNIVKAFNELFLRNYDANGKFSDIAIDDFEIWSYPENSFILRPASGSTDGEMIVCTDTTYTFPGTYAGENVTAWTDGTTIYYVGSEAPAVTEIAQKTFYPVDTTMPELYDSTYGQLIFYSGFNLPNSITVNEIESVSPLKGLKITSSSLGNYISIAGHSALSAGKGFHDAWRGVGVTKNGRKTAWTYADNENIQVEGNIYFFSDYYFNVDDVAKGYAPIRSFKSSGDTYGDLYGFMDDHTAQTWLQTTLPSTTLTVGSDGISEIDMGFSELYEMCFDNLKLYLKPTNALWLTSDSTGADRTFAVIFDDNYTFPTEFNGETVTAWTDGTTLWTAGSEIAKATVAAKTIYPVRVAAAPAEYDEEYGQLVWFDNFSGDTGFTNIANVNLASYITTTATAKAGYSTLPAQQKEFNHHWYEIERNGDAWKYTDNNNLSGDITIYAEIYNALDNTNTVSMNTVVKVKDDTDATCQRKGKRYKNTNKYWGHWGIYDTPWTMKEPYDESVGRSNLQPQDWTTVYTWPITIGENDERFGINIYNTTANSFYARSLAVYVKPDNALWLIDSNGDNRAYEIASDETYTFPTNFNGVDVLTWKNGTTTYAAGETVSIADIAGKTWQVGETVGLAFDDSVSVRVSGTPGIRFKTNLNLAAYTNAKEIGFLATRNKHFVEQFGGLDENLVLTNEKVNNTKYCAHASVSAANIVDTGDGETASFNAVVINVPERKATLTETLHLRSYVTCGGVTYYSAVRKESIYEAAKKISESSGYQDNEYIKNILSICEDTSGN